MSTQHPLLSSIGWWTEEELAAALGVSPKTLQNWRTERSGPAYTRAGGVTLYAADDVSDWLAARREATGTGPIRLRKRSGKQ